MKFSNILTYDLLKQEYVDKGKTMQEIANNVGCCFTTIWYYLRKKHNFPTQIKIQENKIASINEILIAYLAGLIDGDGSIQINKRHKKTEYLASLKICMTNKKIIEWLKDNFGGTIYNWKQKFPNRDMYNWSLNAQESSILLKRTLPYLIVKKQQALNLIVFSNTLLNYGKKLTKTIQEKRELLYQKQKLFNQVGRTI